MSGECFGEYVEELEARLKAAGALELRLRGLLEDLPGLLRLACESRLEALEDERAALRRPYFTAEFTALGAIELEEAHVESTQELGPRMLADAIEAALNRIDYERNCEVARVLPPVAEAPCTWSAPI